MIYKFPMYSFSSPQMYMNSALKSKDRELYSLISKERRRQKEGLELIASENCTSKAVMECLGSVLTNKYAEGMPGARYYGGNEVVDKIENLCIQRALDAYNLDPNEWGVNVQSYSGSSANMGVFLGLLNPHDRIMGLDLYSGGHLTHGFYTSKRKVSATSMIFESLQYSLDSDGFIDYDGLESLAVKFKPKLLVCGYSAYSRDLDYERFRKIADMNSSYLHCDMAHFSGFVAAGELKNPFDYCDVVTTTTHKTLRGPRGGMIFYKKIYENQINQAVFPGLQGGPHVNQIAALATQLKEVNSDEFKTYIKRVKANARRLCHELIKRKYMICTRGTDNHMMLLDLRSLGISGSKVEKVCDAVNISINKNSVPGDKSALNPGGIRIGTPYVTTRGLDEDDMVIVADMLDKTIKLAIEIEKSSPNMSLSENEEIKNLRAEVADFAKQF